MTPANPNVSRLPIVQYFMIPIEYSAWIVYHPAENNRTRPHVNHPAGLPDEARGNEIRRRQTLEFAPKGPE